MRALLGPDMIFVTPGVRPAGADLADQKRVMTPARAIAAGAELSRGGPPGDAGPGPEGGGAGHRRRDRRRRLARRAKKKTPGVPPARRQAPLRGARNVVGDPRISD